MDRMSHKASKYIALAYYLKHADEYGNPASAYTKAFAFEPTSTIEEVFAAIWPDDGLLHFVTPPPIKIEIMPDCNSIPDKPRIEFEEILRRDD